MSDNSRTTLLPTLAESVRLRDHEHNKSVYQAGLMVGLPALVSVMAGGPGVFNILASAGSGAALVLEARSLSWFNRHHGEAQKNTNLRMAIRSASTRSVSAAAGLPMMITDAWNIRAFGREHPDNPVIAPTLAILCMAAAALGVNAVAAQVRRARLKSVLSQAG